MHSIYGGFNAGNVKYKPFKSADVVLLWATQVLQHVDPFLAKASGGMSGLRLRASVMLMVGIYTCIPP